MVSPRRKRKWGFDVFETFNSLLVNIYCGAYNCYFLKVFKSAGNIYRYGIFLWRDFTITTNIFANWIHGDKTEIKQLAY